MIALILGLQIAAAMPGAPGVLAIRSGAAPPDSVPLAAASGGPAVSVRALMPVLPVALRSLDDGRFELTVAGVSLSVADQVPFATVGGRLVALASAPFVTRGELFLPLQVVAEFLPAAAPKRMRFDPARSELRLLGSEAVAAGGARASPPAGRRETRAERTRRVVVDAGHGGPDNGMRGPIGRTPTLYEKEITLDVAKRLATTLRKKGLDVVMTRTTDTLIALGDRGRIANRQRGDLFISIHVNAANPNWQHPADARGYETYFLSEAKTEDARRVEQMENAAVRFETGAQSGGSDALSFLINDMAQNEHLRESSELATVIQSRLAAVHPGPNRGVKQAGFVVLVTAYMPAVLVEIGFGTNPAEARYLSSPARQQEIANAVADAAIAYLDGYERRLGAAAP